jgi:hypothetical protein
MSLNRRECCGLGRPVQVDSAVECSQFADFAVDPATSMAPIDPLAPVPPRRRHRSASIRIVPAPRPRLIASIAPAIDWHRRFHACLARSPLPPRQPGERTGRKFPVAHGRGSDPDHSGLPRFFEPAGSEATSNGSITPAITTMANMVSDAGAWARLATAMPNRAIVIHNAGTPSRR